jgi:hypothetical protein
MSAHVIHGEFSFSCDNCPETIETTKTDFREAYNFIVSRKWLASKDRSGKWHHYCEDCCEEMRL